MSLKNLKNLLNIYKNYMSKLVPPHGSKELKILALEGDDLKIEQKKSSSLTQIVCSSREFGDVTCVL